MSRSGRLRCDPPRSKYQGGQTGAAGALPGAPPRPPPYRGGAGRAGQTVPRRSGRMLQLEPKTPASSTQILRATIQSGEA